MTSQNLRNRAAWLTAFGNSPRKGSKVLPISVNFTLGNPAGVDLSDEVKKSIIDMVQGAFVDNSANPSSLTITSKGCEANIIVPGGYQGFVQFLGSMDNPKFSFTTTGTPTVPIFFLNFPCPALLWSTGSSFGGSTGLDHSANQPALLTNLLGTAAVNASRANVEVQNQSGDTIQVVLDDGAGNNLSIFLLGSGIAAGNQGANWNDNTFKGRVRVFGPNANDQMMLRET